MMDITATRAHTPRPLTFSQTLPVFPMLLLKYCETKREIEEIGRTWARMTRVSKELASSIKSKDVPDGEEGNV